MRRADRGPRRALRHRARAVPPLEADHRLGRQHPRHQRPPVAVHRGGAAQRRRASTPSIRAATAPAQLADRHFFIYPGSDTALALGHDARHHRREAARRRLRRRATPTASTSLRERVRAVSARARRRTHRHRRAKTIVAAGPRVRHHAARRHPPELRRPAQRARRHGRARHRRCCPRSPDPGRTSAAACSSPPPRPSSSTAPALERARSAAASPLGREARLVNMSRARPGAHRPRRSARQGAGGLQLQSRRHRPQSERRARAACAATTCSPWCSSSSRPTPPTTPTSCCPPPPSSSTPTSTSPTATTICNWPGPRCRRPAKPNRTSRSSACSPQRMGFDDACFRDSEDDMIRTLLDSRHPFLEGITLERTRPRALRAPARRADGEPFLPFADGGFGTPSGKCEFGAETLDYTPPVESRLGDAGLRAPLSAGADLAQERRQHELHFRPSRRGGPRRPPSCTCTPPTPPRAASRTATRCACINDRGACSAGGDVDETVRPGVVCAPSVRWGKRAPGRAQRQRAHLRAPHRCRRRPHLLQLPGPSGENRRLMNRRFLRAVRNARRSPARLQPAEISGPAGGGAAPRFRRAYRRHRRRPPTRQWLPRHRKRRLAMDPAEIRGGTRRASRRRRPRSRSRSSFTVPPVTIEKVKSQTLSASIGGTALKPATLDTAGPFTYSREIEPAQLGSPTVKIAFELDKALPPGGRRHPRTRHRRQQLPVEGQVGSAAGPLPQSHYWPPYSGLMRLLVPLTAGWHRAIIVSDIEWQHGAP